MKYLIFLALLANSPAASTVTDDKTFLMWQDVPENRGVVLTWEEAKTECELLDLGGYDDWWLPSEDELVSIVDNSRPVGRKIRKGFVYYEPEPYWTSSTYAWNAPHAWAVDFKNGNSHTLEKSQRRFVRCVRCSDFKECLQRFYEH